LYFGGSPQRFGADMQKVKDKDKKQASAKQVSYCFLG
jgi:hypothetical protein